ncbi:MAG TPA: effector binding domain-containing protein [Anaerolineales bacterium]|nr:effector binding domain-containing protein [Anaerolineales bacterium]
MSNEVRIVRLEPMKVAAALGFGPEPEALAWEALTHWAASEGLRLNEHRLFGFNNPSPTPGSPNYGYEQWLVLKERAIGSAEVQIKDVAGGLYAVMRCHGTPNPEIWQDLVRWREASPYRGAAHQWLEELVTPDLLGQWDQVMFDLYLPIAE